ncbi:MAG: Ppx/GppA family phosphatase [Alphaproteobacteria bacterium]
MRRDRSQNDDPATLPLPPAGRIGVIDIGSNSVRLVVFEARDRAPAVLFNERTLCGLGRGLANGGRLNPDAVALALASLERYAHLARAMHASRLDLLATSAVRDAADGAAFVAEAERRARSPVTVLTGEQESRLAALGVASADPDATGTAGDLGGGSLELVQLDGGRIGGAATLAVGPLRFLDNGSFDAAAATSAMDQALAAISWIDRARHQTFYPVGGAWRALARIHMRQHDYPLDIVHGYAMAAGDMRNLARAIAGMSHGSLGRMAGVPRRRIETLPLAAILMERVLLRLQPSRLVFSSFGLREGHLYDLMDETVRRQDPLIATARAVGHRENRSAAIGQALADWLAPLFSTESPHDRRLRLAACHLADIGWRNHPDRRADHARDRVLYLPTLGLRHDERVFIALAVHARYAGASQPPQDFPIDLLTQEVGKRAVFLGQALRLALSLSGGMPDILAATRPTLTGKGVALDLPGTGAAIMDELIGRRLVAADKAYQAWRAEQPAV